MLKRWPPPPCLGVETDKVKIFYMLRQPIWEVVKCPVCGKVAVRPSKLTVIHASKGHVAVYEAVATGLAWKQARKMAGDSDVFGIFTEENTLKAWRETVQFFDFLARVESIRRFKS